MKIELWNVQNSGISLSTVVLNGRDRHEKHGVPLLCASITFLTIYFTQKPTEIHW